MRIIAGRWRGHGLKPLRGKGVRPTTDRIREAWMSMLAPDLPGARVLDLFAGSGALGLEALSRGAEDVTFVERNRKALGVLKANIDLLGAGDQAVVIPGDAMAFVRRLEPGAFDLALADPPYEKGFAEDLLRLFTEKGFAGQVWVEHRTSEPISPFAGLSQRRYGDTTLSRLSSTE